MGSCLSKKNSCACSSSSITRPNPPEKIKSESRVEKNKTEEETVKKEIFIIKHRKSQDIQRDEEGKGDVKKAEEVVQRVQNLSPNNASGSGNEIIGGGAAGVRTSSCTKEELDAILIQCGRLSRSSSTGKAAAVSESGGRKYAGSKRSYDFDNESGKIDGNDVVDGDEFDGVMGRGSENRHRQRNRQSSGRRRTPSREREREQQRSGSRERIGSGGGRRVSRSPGRRSDSPITIGGTNSSAAIANSKPGKMVSVPATVSSSPMDRSGSVGGGEPNPTASIKRIQVKRNAGGDGAVGARTASSPRARSPARIRTPNENQNVNPSQIQQHPMSLSRSNSRKAEISPYRRNPLSEIDTNVISQAPLQKQNADIRIVQGAAENKLNINKLDGNPTNSNCKTKEETQVMEDESKGSYGIAGHVGLNVITSGPESLKPSHKVTRSRSSRLSRELDINPENLSNPSASYTALLLEDIQNFHQKNIPSFSLPSCVTKACSILEAVADLNSSTSSNISTTYSEDRRRNPPISEQYIKSNDIKLTSAAGKTRSETRDPFVESEMVVNNDLMEPSFHKYVTVGRGTTGLEEMEEQESSGSNSFIGSQQSWISSSCWEPNSADSADRWTSSRSVSRENEVSPVGLQRHATSDSGRGPNDSGKRMSTKKRDSDNNQQTGIGRGRLGSRGPQKTPAAAAAAAAST